MVKVLWIDNDRIFLKPHRTYLRNMGYEVHQIFSLMEGIEVIDEGDANLLILDIMMPVKENEERLFSPKETDYGTMTGLVFYRNFKELLSEKGIKVLVFTIRQDEKIKRMFIEAGLPESNFLTKHEGGDLKVFGQKISQILERE